MFEQTAAWNEYYREMDPARRRPMLDTLCMSEPDDGANAYRYLLFRRRHTDPKDSTREVDHYLFQCVNLGQVYRTARLFKKGAVREVENITVSLGFDQAEKYGEAGEKALYWEIRNGAARFFATCADPAYNRALFGLVSSTETGRKEQMIRDVYAMTDGLIQRTGCQEQLRLWKMGVLDQMTASFPDVGGAYEAYIAKTIGK